MKAFSRVLLALLLLPAAFRSVGLAQEGTISGVVTEGGTDSPLPGVSVALKHPVDTAVSSGTYTDLSGRYTLKRLAPGRYLLTFSIIGFRKIVDTTVEVTDNAVVTLDAHLESVPLHMDAVIVSASRREEKAVSAPGSTSVIDAATIAERPAVTPIDHLRSTGGIDIAQTGLMQQTVVSRAFNNVFSTTLMMLTDNRIAAVPSLRANIPAFIPIVDDDLERIEVVRGPASALYGPNAHNGVVNFVTRSPFASKGTTVSLAGGNRSLMQGSVRHAGTIGERVGYKVSAGYFRGLDWAYTDSAEAEARKEAIDSGAVVDTLRVGKRESFVERFGGEARVDFILGDRATANLTVGVNQAGKTIELTDIGASQGIDWTYSFIQARMTLGSLFFQGFLNASNSGDSYILRTGLPVVDRSRLFVAQAQNTSTIGDRELLTYGVDLHLTRPVTDGTINGRNENDDHIDEIGGYIQSETRIVPGFLDLVLATRADYNNRLEDVVFSPRAAVVFHPDDRQSVRLTYNRAYSTPNTTELFLDIVARENFMGARMPDEYDLDLRGSGVPKEGYLFARDGNGRPMMHSQFNPPGAPAMSVDDVALLWPAIVQAAYTYYGVDLSGIPAPSPSDIGAVMALLDPEAETEAEAYPVIVDDVSDVSGLKPTITNTIEAGYKGAIGGAFVAGIDVYGERVTNFIGQFEVVTPNVFMNASDVINYLRNNGLSAVDAVAYGSIIGTLPLGTVSPEGVADPTAVMVAPRNFGKVEIWGADISLEFSPSLSWQAIGTFSFISKNFFEKLDGEVDLSLNTPEKRGTFTLRYRDEGGAFHVEGRARWMSGFRMMSGVYVGDVAPYTLFDLNAGAAIPWIPGTGVTLSVLNIFDTMHREFVGAPEMGALAVGKIHYTL